MEYKGRMGSKLSLSQSNMSNKQNDIYEEDKRDALMEQFMEENPELPDDWIPDEFDRWMSERIEDDQA